MQDEGYVAKILYPDGAKDVLLGEPLAILVENLEDIPAFADWVAGGAPEAAADATPEVEATPEVAAAVPSGSMAKAQSGDRKFISPIAARIAKEKGLDLSSVRGTGPNDRIILADVEEALKAGPVKVAEDVIVHKTPAAAAPVAAPQKTAAAAPQKVEMPNSLFKDIEVTQIRKIIAERLTHSK